METICTPDFPGQGLGGSGHRFPNLEDSPNMHKNSDFIFSTLKKGHYCYAESSCYMLGIVLGTLHI